MFKGHPLDSALRALKEQLNESTLLSSSADTVRFESRVISVLCGGTLDAGFWGLVSQWQERVLPSGPLFSSLFPQVPFPSSSLEGCLPGAAGDETT